MIAEDVALICKALGDPNRLRIVQLLTKGEKCGCELLDEFNITQPTLSHHMKVLGECGLTNDRKEGRWHYYSLNCDTFTELRDFVSSLTCDCSGVGNNNCGSALCCSCHGKDAE